MKYILFLSIFFPMSIFFLSLIPIDRSAGVVSGDIIAPEEVKNILRSSCYDCHSYETKYPFYSYIFPISIIINNHIKEGREELNFSMFQELSDAKKRSKFKSMIEDIETGEMPLFGYTIMHRDAILTPEKKHILINWAKENGGESEEDDN
jgi:hypothetical protein